MSAWRGKTKGGFGFGPAVLEVTKSKGLESGGSRSWIRFMPTCGCLGRKTSAMVEELCCEHLYSQLAILFLTPLLPGPTQSRAAGADGRSTSEIVVTTAVNVVEEVLCKGRRRVSPGKTQDRECRVDSKIHVVDAA